jgi:hypothetical protein
MMRALLYMGAVLFTVVGLGFTLWMGARYIDQCSYSTESSQLLVSIHNRVGNACRAPAATAIVGRYLDDHPNQRVTRDVHDSRGAVTMIWLEYYTPVA